MIVKHRKVPLKIRKLEALLRRLPPNHSKRIEVEQELARRLSGYKGEQSLDYFLSFLPEQEYLILHDIRLTEKTHYFQIDTLILSSSFFLILEAKNLSGTLIFDHMFHQLIRIINGKEEVFPDPVQQVKHQQFQFAKWLKNNQFPLIPLEAFVVMTNPNALIKTSPGNTPSPSVIRTPSLLEKVNIFKEMYQEEKLSKKEIRRLCKLLIKHHTPGNLDVLQQFQINESDLLTGVHCPNCSVLPMERKWGKWNCANCSFSSKDAHLHALNDYYLLFQAMITNQRLRNFLQLSSSTVAKKLLLSLNTPYSGEKRGRSYHLPFEEE
ncbi:nuclease-related domain-containing protein [Fictibacillus sp. Mic-4]|uniref:nuclease-related domain-containing protein n=1 Tax=Fictibacillus sp. Mic-4 TaxID=3132826 RepID=UPI003CF279C8